MTQPDPNETPNDAVRTTQEVRPTQVWFVQGKKANKEFRSALSLHRENATLSEKDVEQADPQPDVNKEEGQHV